MTEQAKLFIDENMAIVHGRNQNNEQDEDNEQTSPYYEKDDMDEHNNYKEGYVPREVEPEVQTPWSPTRNDNDEWDDHSDAEPDADDDPFFWRNNRTDGEEDDA